VGLARNIGTHDFSWVFKDCAFSELRVKLFRMLALS
jgi:hypothetical protein